MGPVIFPPSAAKNAPPLYKNDLIGYYMTQHDDHSLLPPVDSELVYRRSFF